VYKKTLAVATRSVRFPSNFESPLPPVVSQGAL